MSCCCDAFRSRRERVAPSVAGAAEGRVARSPSWRRRNFSLVVAALRQAQGRPGFAGAGIIVRHPRAGGDPASFHLDVPVFFRPPPRRACDFSLRRQREVTKRKATPRTRPSLIPALRVRARTPGFADGPSLGLRRTDPHPAGHPADFSCVRSPCSRGPVGAHPARVIERSGLRDLALNEAMDGRHWAEALLAPLHDAEHRSAKREQGANVRAQGCASSRRPAWREKRRVVEPTRGRRDRHSGRSGFGYFPRKESNPFGGSRTEPLHCKRAEPLLWATP
jgi:hypothetical protein